jgi:uncharacterized membrane protein YsdA (DUF1294 family)
MRSFLLLCLLGLNLIAFFAFGHDKRRARLQRTRTRESTLLILSLLGGAPGAWIAVRIFRHKTRKITFLIPLVFATLVAAALWYGLYQLYWNSTHD